MVNSWLCSVTAGMAVVSENEYIWSWGRSQSTKVLKKYKSGKLCLESPPPIPWTHGKELECHVGHSVPGLEHSHLLLTFSYFSKHMQSIYQAIKNTLWGVAINNCRCQNEKSFVKLFFFKDFEKVFVKLVIVYSEGNELLWVLLWCLHATLQNSVQCLSSLC